MLSFKEFKDAQTIQESIANISGNYKNIWYEVSSHADKMKGLEDRSKRTVVTNKSFEKRIKDAMRVMSKKHEMIPGQEYFVTFITDNVRCGFPFMLDDPKKPVSIVQPLHPMSKKYDFVALVKTPTPCYDKETNKPYAKPNDIKIKLSENVEQCIGHELIPEDINNYLLSTFQYSLLESDDASFYTITNLSEFGREYTVIVENGLVTEQRKDNGLHIVDLDAEMVY